MSNHQVYIVENTYETPDVVYMRVDTILPTNAFQISIHELHLHLFSFSMVVVKMNNASGSTSVSNVRHDARTVPEIISKPNFRILFSHFPPEARFLKV